MANQIPCVGHGSHQQCLNILTDFVPNVYQLSNLIGSKCKGESNSCCVWSAFYVGVNNVSIPDNETVRAAKIIAANQPGCAKPVKIGKAWSGNQLGVIVRWKKTNCTCGSFFEFSSTTLYLIELQIERQIIFTGHSSNKLTSWKFGKEKYEFTFVHKERNVDYTTIELINTAMALQDVSHIEKNEVLYVCTITDLIIIVRIKCEVIEVDVRKEILSFLSSIYPGRLFLSSIDVWSNNDDEDDLTSVSLEESTISNVNLSDISQSTMATMHFIIKTFANFQGPSETLSFGNLLTKFKNIFH